MFSMVQRKGLLGTLPLRRGHNVDDSLFPLESIFRIGRITRTVSRLAAFGRTWAGDRR